MRGMNEVSEIQDKLALSSNHIVVRRRDAEKPLWQMWLAVRDRKPRRVMQLSNLATDNNLTLGAPENHVGVEQPNDPSSATASAGRVERTVRSQLPATLERMAQRPFAAAHG